jgi:hypothetical protein
MFVGSRETHSTREIAPQNLCNFTSHARETGGLRATQKFCNEGSNRRPESIRAETLGSR